MAAGQPYTLPSSLDVMLGSRNSSESRRDTDEYDSYPTVPDDPSSESGH
jgi:hypothetical protein